MSESTEIVNEPIAPAVEPPKEFRYEYQPKDEEGRNLGAPQVIIATSPEEALAKMAEQNTQLIKLNRKLNKDIRLGTVFQDNIPEDAPRSRHAQYEFKPEPLSADERLQVIQDLNDPEKCDAATARLIRSQIGDPNQIAESLSRAEQRIAAMDAKEQATAFVRSTPDYYPCQENTETLINWMLKNDLEPVKENFARAFAELGSKGANILSERPVAAVPVSAPIPEPVEAKAPETVQQPTPQPVKKPGAYGLTRDNSSDQGPVPKPQGYTDAEIDKMTSAQYKQLILIPERKLQQRKQQSAAV